MPTSLISRAKYQYVQSVNRDPPFHSQKWSDHIPENHPTFVRFYSAEKSPVLKFRPPRHQHIERADRSGLLPAVKKSGIRFLRTRRPFSLTRLQTGQLPTQSARQYQNKSRTSRVEAPSAGVYEPSKRTEKVRPASPDIL